jgi:hypothetical protein
VADPARKGEFAAVVVQVWRAPGNQQVEATGGRCEREQDRSRCGTRGQGERVVLGQRIPDSGLQVGGCVQINGSLARFFSSAMVAV